MAFSSIDYALSQVTYPGAGDVDDCWVVATIHAARRSLGAQMLMPTVPEFRAAAGNPDDPNASDGGTLTQIMEAVPKLWPQLGVRRYGSRDTADFESYLRHGWTASLAVLSSGLPLSMQHGFKGSHQVSVFYVDGAYWLMNPLQRSGDAPHRIEFDQIIQAARQFGLGYILAALFPPASEVTSMAFVINFQRFSVKADTPFYETPGGARIGAISNDSTVTGFGVPLDRSTDASPGRNMAWRAVMVSTGAMDKTVARKVVYFRTQDLTEISTSSSWDNQLVALLSNPTLTVADPEVEADLKQAKALAQQIVAL